MSGNSLKDNDEFTVEFESLFESESDNDSPSYKRRLFSDDDVKRLIQKNQSNQLGGEKLGSELRPAVLDPDGNIIFRRKRVGPPRPVPPFPDPEPNPNPDVPSNETGTETINGPLKLKVAKL